MSRRECPNPKCRSTDVIVLLSMPVGINRVMCQSCLMLGPSGKTEQAADAAWNALPREEPGHVSIPIKCQSCGSTEFSTYRLRFAWEDESAWRWRAGCEKCGAFGKKGATEAEALVAYMTKELE
jgi:hypothetical protein